MSERLVQLQIVVERDPTKLSEVSKSATLVAAL